MKIYTNEQITKKLNRRNKIKKIIKSIIYPIIILIFICNIVLIMQKLTRQEEVPNFLGYKVFAIVSGSMEPTLQIGDLVIIKVTDQEKIKEKDIITFMEDGYNVTHRIVNIVQKDDKYYYQTKGDNNTANDKNLVSYEDIEGVYVFKIPKIGNIVKYTQNTTFFIIVICIIYIIYKIISRKEDIESARHEKRKEFEKRKK